MAPTTPGSKATPQIFIDKLYNDKEIIAELDDTHPRSFVTLDTIGARCCPPHSQSPTASSARSSSFDCGRPLSSSLLTSSHMSDARHHMPESKVNIDRSDSEFETMPKVQDTVQRSQSMPAEGSLTTIGLQTEQSASFTHDPESQSRPEPNEVVQDDSFAMPNQGYDFPSLRLAGSRRPNPYRRPHEMFPTYASTGLDQTSISHTPKSHLMNTYQEQQSTSQNALGHGLPAVAVRHDRDSLYTVRIRTDGSTSLIRVRHGSSFEQNIDSGADSLGLMDDNLPQEKEGSEKDEENEREFKNRLTQTIQQMMFVSGETVEPSTETTWMIEEIVRDQVIEMLKEATGLANRRGSKSISIVDLIFQIRHNPAKVSRLKTFLSWKDVRKNVKDSDDKAGGGDADALDLDEGALPGANPAAPQKTSTNKKAKLILPWEIQSYYSETVPEREDEEDEEEEEQNEATLARLASADERTKNMTREEYVYWSDCRQASFTFRKGKRFREWAGFGTVIDSKPNDDVVDILGFLTFEIVQTLTEEALKVKLAEDLANKKASGLRTDNESTKKRKREGCTLFEMPEEDRTPVEPKHVREAFRRLQLVPNKYKFMRQGYAGVRTPLRMI